MRVREGGEITHRIRVDTHAYAVMLGGPERRHLFICASGSHDPAEIQRNPSASFQVVEVDVPGSLLTKRGTPATWIQTTTNGTDFRVIFIRRKDAAEAGLVYTPEFSGDLVNWAPSNVTPTVVADGGEVEAVSINYPFFAAGRKARYFRVGVSSTH